MQPYPHTYTASANGSPNGVVAVDSKGCVTLRTAAPAQFGGPEGLWSPESLFCAAMANCFVLTFRSIARASKLEWWDLTCNVEGTLERTAAEVSFTHFATTATLEVPEEADIGVCRTLLEKAERVCLIANSLKGSRSLQVQINTRNLAFG